MATRTKAPKPEADSTTPEAPAEATSTTKTEAPDITAFVAAADAAVAQGGDPAQRDYKAVTEAYRALERTGKAAATAHANAKMKEALTVLADRDAAVSWMTLADAIKSRPASEKAAKTPREPVNPTESFVERLASLHLAVEVAQSVDLPENLDADWADKLTAKVNEVRESGEITKLIEHRKSTDENKGEAPEVSEVAGKAVRLAFTGATRKVSGGGTVNRTYEGPRRSVSNHILSAFEGKPSGTFLSVAEIRNHRSTEYGEDTPSAGAVSAALNGKSIPEGLTAGKGGEKNTFGATKN